MAFEIELGSPQAASLQSVVQTKLMELGWSTDNLDDTSLAEYIVLILADENYSREKLEAEISEAIGVDKQDAAISDFVRWVVDQTEKMLGGGQTSQASQAPQHDQTLQHNSQEPAVGATGVANAGDTEMGDAKDGSEPSIPTGPKSMRNAPHRTRDRRMLGQVNNAMDRSSPDGMLHRIKGAAGRINTHSHDPPKGPTPRGPRATMQRFAGGRNNNANMPMNPMNQPNMFGAMTPQQQMQLFAMYEDQARMMAQILSPQQQQQLFSTQTGQQQQQQQQQPGKSLFERIDGGQAGDASNHTFNTASSNQNELTSSMEVESSTQDGTKPDPSTTMCRFNLSCTKADCHFAHQSPVAPPGTIVDMTDECTFGAACKNRKCTAKHPSPAKLAPQRAEQDCKFYPNCTNPNCPFRHPSMPPCRNGADCNVPGCKFAHSKIACKFDPCLNPSCPYKHAQGHRRGTYADKVWVNKSENGDDGDHVNQEEASHVSDRKFVDENAGEELIRPGQEEQAAAAAADAIAT